MKSDETQRDALCRSFANHAEQAKDNLVADMRAVGMTFAEQYGVIESLRACMRVAWAAIDRRLQQIPPEGEWPAPGPGGSAEVTRSPEPATPNLSRNTPKVRVRKVAKRVSMSSPKGGAD